MFILGWRDLPFIPTTTTRCSYEIFIEPHRFGVVTYGHLSIPRQGFEPRWAAPKTAVLPLDDLGTIILQFLKLFLRFSKPSIALFLLVFVGEKEGQKALQLIFAFESKLNFICRGIDSKNARNFSKHHLTRVFEVCPKLVSLAAFEAKNPC